MTAKAQSLYPKTVPFQIFQHAKTSKSSKATSQNGEFPNLSTCQSSKPISQNVTFPNFQQTKKAKAQNLRPTTVLFQIFQYARNSKSSNPTSQNITFPNLPTCQQRQKLKTYISKHYVCKSSNMPPTAKARNLQLKTVPFQILQHSKCTKTSKS